MGYTDCANGVLATLSTLTAYFGTTPAISLADTSILKQGVTGSAAVLIPGGFGPLRDASAAWRTWDVIVGLFQRTSNTPPIVAASFVEMRDAVVHLIDFTPNLGATGSAAGIFNTTTASMGDPAPYSLVDGQPPSFVVQWIRVSVAQKVTA